MIVSAIMPIKLHNERLPGKNTKLLGNKPLLHYQLEALKKTGLYTNITVFCSDEAIVPFLPDGVEFLKRSPELDSPSSNFSQIFTSYISLVDADVYLYAHVTAPFVTVATIKTCINAVTSGAYDSAFCASKIQDFLWRNGKPLNFDAKNMPRSQDLDLIYRETSGVYVFTKKVFEQYHRRIGNRPYIHEVTYREAVDINEPEDFKLAEIMLSIVPGESRG
jgi:CMP-N-acetylneuraminic acid synthetase